MIEFVQRTAAMWIPATGILVYILICALLAMAMDYLTDNRDANESTDQK